MVKAWTIWFHLWFWPFLVLELYAMLSKTPTLSHVVWELESTYPWSRWAIAVGLVLLMFHFVAVPPSITQR